jgi:uncharacterized protein (DUF488 family)
MEFYTIGVYGSTEEVFFEKLTSNSIDTFCDVRRRRGMRGALYAFANSRYLQDKLEKLGITYRHILELAPTKEIRELQRQADQEQKEEKRQRQQLSTGYISAYRNEILNPFDFEPFIKELQAVGAERVALFCVEACHEACHRSLITEKLHEKFQFEVIHL